MDNSTKTTTTQHHQSQGTQASTGDSPPSVMESCQPTSGHRTHHSHIHHGHHHHHHHRPLEVIFEDICVKMPSDKVTSEKMLLNTKKKDMILSSVSGHAKPGQILGIMGPSGSGKTTLLSTLSGRMKASSGQILLNGETLSKGLRRKIAYVLQSDIFFSDLTLRQTLMYTALLRLPDSMPRDKKTKLVDHILDVLDLTHCQDTMIGDMMKRGLSGGEKKRASIACELLTNPTILLIDEPTSGLDSSTAFDLIRLLKNYSVKEKKTIVLTIHQPSSQIFYMFDNLLLLTSGQLAYFGPVHQVVPFFSRIGLNMDSHYNPGDFVMEKVKSSTPEIVDRIIAEATKLDKLPIPPGQQQQLPVPSSQGSSSCSYSVRDRGNSLNSRESTQEVHEIQETSPLWMEVEVDHHDDDNEDNCLSAEVELQVVVVDKKSPSQNGHPGRDCDSGRSSLTDMDRSSSSTDMASSSSSTSSCSDEMYFDFSDNILRRKKDDHRKTANHQSSNERDNHAYKTSERKWPTSFMTQLTVLTTRNFYEARGRMLSKLNFIQTIVLALVTGSIWYQIPRREETLNDVKGWIFFSMTYWMLFSLFNALVSFPAERQVIMKERSSGSYRLSSYYMAKMIGELPLTIVMPTIFHLISYPLLGCYNLETLFFLWMQQILSSLVAQSVGLLVGASCVDLEVSITISALYSMSSILFGGFYSTTMPTWLNWIRYLSIVYYSFLNMQMIEFSMGSDVVCSLSKSRFDSCLRNVTATDLKPTTIPYEELKLHLDITSRSPVEPFPIWVNTLILFVFLISIRLAGYVVLRYIRRPK